MDSIEISQLCIESCKRYYDYLSENNSGREEVNIVEISFIVHSDKLWELRLGGRIFNCDLIKIQNLRSQITYDGNDFGVESYDRDTNRLIIKIKNELMDFQHVSTNELLLISDLKFLVENVRKWYLQNGHMLGLPSLKPQLIVDDEFEYTGNPNPDQLTAIDNCLKTPICYIWGPPGSGKTRNVLTNAILQYHEQPDPHRIGVFAPTNNALEQVMEAVISIADELGIERDKFLRIGTPSKKFATKYPEVCEVRGIQNARNKLQAQIHIISEVITYRLGQNAINSANEIIPNLTEIQNLLDKNDELLLQHSKAEKEINDLKKQASSILNNLKKWVSSKEIAVEVLIREKTEELRDISEQISELDNQINIRFARIRRTVTSSIRINNCLRALSFQNIGEIKTSIIEIKKNTVNFLAEREAHAIEYRAATMEELENRKERLLRELAHLDSVETEKRIRGSFVIGATLDSYIGRFMDNQISLSHIFIDEAGYLPLIKAVVLCRKNVPVTFLGDHKQLSPVCEMNDNELSNPLNRSVILWSTSSLYCGSVFTLDKEELLDNLYSPQPEMHAISRSELRITHRFGPNLTAILGRLFYPFGFESANNLFCKQVELSIIDAPFYGITNGRQNKSECDAIEQLLTNITESDFIILTPYKDQVSLLNHTIPLIRSEQKALTIHKSQGKEWDTVVISIVDGKKISPWFTDVRNIESKGAHVMNTAISRVKKKLFLVCDKSYWTNRGDCEQQLISCLISQGQN